VRADLEALLVDHACHARERNESRHEEEHERQEQRDLLDAVGIGGELRGACVLRAVHDEDLGALDVVDVALRVGELRLGVGELLVGFGAAVLVLREAVGVFPLAVLVFRQAALVLGEALVVFGPALLELRPAAVELRARGGELRLRGVDLGLRGLELRNARVELRELLSERVRLCPRLRELRLDGGDLLGRRPGCLRLRELLLEHCHAGLRLLDPCDELFALRPELADSGVFPLELGKARVELGLPLRVALLAFAQLGFVIRYLAGAGIKLRPGLRELGSGIVELLAGVVELGPRIRELGFGIGLLAFVVGARIVELLLGFAPDVVPALCGDFRRSIIHAGLHLAHGVFVGLALPGQVRRGGHRQVCGGIRQVLGEGGRVDVEVQIERARPELRGAQEAGGCVGGGIHQAADPEQRARERVLHIGFCRLFDLDRVADADAELFGRVGGHDAFARSGRP